MLKRCSDKKDVAEWNEWREQHPNQEILLEGADLAKAQLERANLARANLSYAHLYEANLKGVNLDMANLQSARMQRANLEGAFIPMANLQNADLIEVNLKNAHLGGANLEGADFETVTVDGGTLIWNCKVSRYSKNKHFTNFAGVGLDSARIDAGIKQLLEYNIRRKNWDEWYKEHWLLRWPVWSFWLLSNYGLRTWRIIFTFFGLAFGFALVYWLLPSSVIVNGGNDDIRGLWHAVYFSVVTMTTLGFGDIAANPDSWIGQTLLMVQVILGYVLLGALITRFAVLFTAGGPAGKFANDKGRKTDDGRQNDKN